MTATRLALKRTLSGWAIYDLAAFDHLGLPGKLVRRLAPGTSREAAEAELARAIEAVR